MSKDLVVVMTALELEYEAVREYLASPQLHRHDEGTHFEVGQLSGTSTRIALVQCGKGNHPSAVVTERAIQQFSPAAVLFVGVAGALSDKPTIGDIVVATQVYGYHGATSEDDGAKARPRTWETSHKTLQAAQNIKRTNDWTRPPEPQQQTDVHFGPIAAGEVVQNARRSYEAEWLRQHYHDALAVEMEAAGVAQAGHFNEVPVAIIRGISDHADGNKSTDSDAGRQPRAARNATAFAMRLAQDLTEEQEPSMQADEQHPTTAIKIGNGNTIGLVANKASNNTVDQNTGSQQVGPMAIFDTLSEIRDALDRQHRSGTIDRTTYETAQNDLDFADKALQDPEPEARNRAVVALKRLKILVEDCADLTIKITTVITALGGLT